MQAFEYANPSTLKEALALLGPNWDDAHILAGGTDQISLMKDYIHKPKRVVNIKGIRELHGVGKSGQDLRIGAAVTFDDLASNSEIRAAYPSITAAVLGVASPQIRNMGTAGGDLCQRPRCWYFRNGYGLLAMKDGRSLVPNGENRYHAIFPQGSAYFVNASSLAPALIALGAKLKIASASGTRTVAVEKFFVVPENENAREIDLKPNEILTEILIPGGQMKNATYEVRQKDALDWPLAAAAVALQMNGSNVRTARIVLGHVAPTPMAADGAEKALAGKPLDDSSIAAAAEAAVAGAKPLSQNGYKVQLTRAAVKRALQEVAGKA